MTVRELYEMMMRPRAQVAFRFKDSSVPPNAFVDCDGWYEFDLELEVYDVYDDGNQVVVELCTK